MSIGENDHKTMRNDDEMAPKKHPGRPAGKKKNKEWVCVKMGFAKIPFSGLVGKIETRNHGFPHEISGFPWFSCKFTLKTDPVIHGSSNMIWAQASEVQHARCTP